MRTSHRIATFIVIIVALLAAPISISRAQSTDSAFLQPPKETFYKARIEKVLEQGEENLFGIKSGYQKVLAVLQDGDEKGKEIVLTYGKGGGVAISQLVAAGDTVLVSKSLMPQDSEPVYRIVDQYRLPKIIPILVVFFAAILLLSRWQGIGSILGMVFSLGIIIKYIIPGILAGKDPLTVSIAGCFIIMVTTIYLAHGFSRKTTVALLSTFLTLLVTGGLAVLFVEITKLTGLGTEDASALKLGPTANINFRGLLLGGILIGALGVLDDVTTGLSASVFELAKANRAYGFRQLFRSGLAIGREHIASLVNTLVLAYAGASLPIFLTIALNPAGYPMRVILNDGLIVEEAVRTLAGSIGLVAAVPLTTILASYIAAMENKRHDS